MESKAKITDISADINSGAIKLSITLDSKHMEFGLADGRDLLLKLTEWRERRSLNANAYFHVLAGKIAERTAQSRTEAKNILISRYGQYEHIGDGIAWVLMSDAVEWQKLEYLHLIPTQATRTVNGKTCRQFLIMRGSHTYDTKEMSRLIAGAVSEAQELGIETLTPAELERMVNKWSPA